MDLTEFKKCLMFNNNNKEVKLINFCQKIVVGDKCTFYLKNLYKNDNLEIFIPNKSMIYRFYTNNNEPTLDNYFIKDISKLTYVKNNKLIIYFSNQECITLNLFEDLTSEFLFEFIDTIEQIYDYIINEIDKLNKGW